MISSLLAQDRLKQDANTLAAAYPALLAEAERVASIVATGLHGRRQAGQGETFWQYRPYQNTDAARRIDWRRSAKGDSLFVRDNEWEAANTIYFWLDKNPGMNWKSSQSLPLKSERAAIISLALAKLLMKGGEHCAILGQDKRTRTGRVGFDRLLEDLLSSEGSQKDFTVPIKSYSRNIIASDFLSPITEWKDRLTALANHSAKGVLLHIIDPAEEAFPYKGRVELKMPGLNTLKSFIVGRAENSREDYQARFERHIQDVESLAKSIGWHVIRHDTSEPATHALNL